MTETEIKKAQRISRIVDVKVVCEPPSWIYRLYYKKPETLEKELNKWINEFDDFIRDHRSQDPVILFTERVIENQCTNCGNSKDVDFGPDIEIDPTGKNIYCYGCGALIEKQA